MKQSQVNVRIESGQLEILEAAAFLEGRSVGDLVRTRIEELAAELSAVDEISSIVALRQQRRAVIAGATPIRPRGTRNSAAS